MESRKRRKSNEDDQDMISNLPDFIIARILSHLPTKYAVRTSVLYKSWLYHWTFITKLHFEDKEPNNPSMKIKKKIFSDFVFRVLLHLNTSSIQSFSLSVARTCEASHVDQWISAVLNRRVKELCVNSKEKQTLPSHSLLKYKSLEKLVLCVGSCDIRVPTSASLSSLTVLNLSGIKFICDRSGKVDVDLDFPVLRTYKTQNCTWSSSVKSVTLKAPLLKVVSIKHFGIRSSSNSYTVVMKFCASHLTEFTYTGSGTVYEFDLSAARIAYANIDIYHAQETVALHNKLLKQFKNVKWLEFQRSQKVLPQLAKDSLADLPTFEKLSQLNLGKVNGEILLALLLKTPNLKALIFLELAINMESPNNGQDMISDLPDFIIGRILSFLLTKDAVSTSVLSKSWIYRWTFITELHFEDIEWSSTTITERRKKLYVNFVYRVLLHLNSSSIQSFSLTMIDDYEDFHVDKWISDVISRSVKKLCVESRAHSSHSLMRYKSLEELRLTGYCCGSIRIPPFACLSSLTVLHLCGIHLIGDTCNNTGKIHLDFPLLRRFKTKNCTWSSTLKYVNLEAPLLEVVSIDECSHSKDGYPYPTIKFCASHLTEFTYRCYPLPNPIVFDFSATHIASAHIHIHWYHLRDSLQEIMPFSSKILKQFKNVESLTYQKWSLEDFLAKDVVADLPSFEMLSHLELGYVTGEILLALLLKTPYLRTLIFEKLLQHDQEELLNYDFVPKCFLTTLQVVKLTRLYGSEHELSFAKFVMENAVALKRMSFIPYCWIDCSVLEEVKEKLYSFKKCCSSMILEFQT